VFDSSEREGGIMPFQFTEFLPKALAFGALIWAIINWAFLGPELGARSLRANGHIEQCERGYGDALTASIKDEMSKIPLPTPDPEKEHAANAIRQMQNSPFGQLMNQMGGSYGVSLESTLGMYEQQKRNAKAEYDRAVAALKERTKNNLGKAGDYCGCVADEAVSSAQNDFALYSGSLTLFRPAGIRNLDNLMMRASAGNACAHLKG